MKQMNLGNHKSRVEQNTKVTLYHGSPNYVVKPHFGLGKDYHDYGRGFYLTPDAELAKEWAVGTSRIDGWMHTFELDLAGLLGYDFDLPMTTLPLGKNPFPQLAGFYHIFVWMGVLLAHRGAANPDANWFYDAQDFVARYAIDCDKFDYLKGWRADDSYFQIAARFAEGRLDVTWLPELLHLGDLGIQYCIKSREGFDNLRVIGDPVPVSFAVYGPRYDARDARSRININRYINQRRAAGFKADIIIFSLL